METVRVGNMDKPPSTTRKFLGSFSATRSIKQPVCTQTFLCVFWGVEVQQTIYSFHQTPQQVCDFRQKSSEPVI